MPRSNQQHPFQGHDADLTVYRERVVLAGVITPEERTRYTAPLAELADLADTAGADVLGEITQNARKPHPVHYVGKGKLVELAAVCAQWNADTVIIDHDLTPRQGKHLEDALELKVVDRTELILDIFASHARTKQAQLQVELAQLRYALPRLKRMWTHLDRIKGGIGMRGAGERQLESDKRLMRGRIRALERSIAAIDRRRVRAVEARRNLFTISLVGYTNAGKSTLMRRLTGSDVLVADRLFSTLDTRTRVWKMADGRRALLSDTVGFLRKLPHHLVASFHATLEEAIHADLLLVVTDASHPDCRTHIEAVGDILGRIGAGGRPTVHVFNKVDLGVDAVDVTRLADEFPEHVFVSARTGQAIDELESVVGAHMAARETELRLAVPAANGRLLAYLERHATVLDRHWEGEVCHMHLRVSLEHLGDIQRMGGPTEENSVTANADK